jgi:ABC-type glutathione transport system ATPase component
MGCMAAPPQPVLTVQDLSIDLLPERGDPRTVVAGVSFDVFPSTIVGLFGESGCGKTTLALALLRLLPSPRYRVRGSVRLAGRDLLALGPGELQRIRGAQIAMVFQDPLRALNPVMRVGRQVEEVFRAHGVAGSAEALFDMVGLSSERRMLDAYPHQLSGGERQRVTIAQALACRPAVVIADEPFTAIDVVRVVELAALFRELTARTGAAFLLISHSPGVLATVADSVMVMHTGRIVARGEPSEVLAHAF